MGSAFTDGRGQAFSFCNATISRKTMEADAHNIAFCPYACGLQHRGRAQKCMAYRRLF